MTVEKHFQSTHSHDSSGRYIVSYPFKLNAPLLELGNRAVVINTLTRLIHWLIKNSKIGDIYCAFRQEYQQLGDMVPEPTSRPYLLSPTGTKMF